MSSCLLYVYDGSDDVVDEDEDHKMIMIMMTTFFFLSSFEHDFALYIKQERAGMVSLLVGPFLTTRHLARVHLEQKKKIQIMALDPSMQSPKARACP